MTARTHRFHRVSRLAAVLCMAAAGAMAAPASAQPDTGGFIALGQHDYLHRDMVIFAQGLNLDDGQRMIVESLYEDYRDAFDAGWLRTQERLNEIRHSESTDPNEVLNAVLAPFEQWRVEKQRIKERFEEDVKVLLGPEQLNQWESFQRRMTREKTLPQARLSGENVDLFHVVRELNLDERGNMALEPVMQQYEMAMDEALRRRNAIIEEGHRNLFDAIRKQDPAAGVSGMDQQIQRRVDVRNVNDRYIEIIAGYLTEAKAADFRANALDRGYPRVYRITPAQRIFREALRMTGLDPDVKQGIIDLNNQLNTEMASHNATILEALRDHEPRALKNQSDIFAARQSGERVERLMDPTHELIRARDTRANQLVEELKNLMGEEEFAKLPGSSRWLADTSRAASDPAQGVDRLHSPRGGTPALGPNQPKRDGNVREPGGRDQVDDPKGSGGREAPRGRGNR